MTWTIQLESNTCRHHREGWIIEESKTKVFCTHPGHPNSTAVRNKLPLCQEETCPIPASQIAVQCASIADRTAKKIWDELDFDEAFYGEQGAEAVADAIRTHFELEEPRFQG